MKKWIIVILIILTLFGWLIQRVISLRHIMDIADAKDSTRNVSMAPPEYLNLFKKNEKLIFQITVKSKTRNLISQFQYDKKYSINVYRLDILSNSNLNEIINESHLDDHITYHLTYNLLDPFDKYEILYKSGVQGMASKIYLNLSGDQTQLILKNDSIAYYYSKLESFSIKYKLNDPQDFFGSIKDENSTQRFPIEIMFIKRNGKLYLILMSPENLSERLIPGTLMSLISK